MRFLEVTGERSQYGSGSGDSKPTIRRWDDRFVVRVHLSAMIAEIPTVTRQHFFTLFDTDRLWRKSVL